MKDNEWYTPGIYIQAAREVMGGIDLDPASCVEANKTVNAIQYYTREQNGLMQPWHGRIWCNPPYGRTQGGQAMSHQKAFALKLWSEYHRGNIEQAILLSLGNSNSTWFQPFFDFPVCCQNGTIVFTRPDGSEGHFGFPLSFIYLGDNEQKFIDVFSSFGRIVRAIDAKPVKVVKLELWEG